MIAPELYLEREKRSEREAQYLPLIKAWFGEQLYDTAAAQDETLIKEIDASLDAISESSPYGNMQRYILEECLLYGRTAEDVGRELATYAEVLVQRMNNATLRALRHPNLSKPVRTALKPYVQKTDEE